MENVTNDTNEWIVGMNLAVTKSSHVGLIKTK